MQTSLYSKPDEQSMEIPQAQIQRAIEDIALLRRALTPKRQVEEPQQVQESIAANLVLQFAGFVTALGLLAAELLTRHASSQFLRLSANEQDLRLSTIGMIALILLILVAALYFVVYRASRHSQRDFSAFVARNFAYLRNLSFLSDLLIKFGILSLLIHLGHPTWVAPVLFVFIGDYLIQGRYFTLPLRTSLILGTTCLAAGAIQAVVGSVLLSWPLAGFVAVSGLSVGQVILLRKRQREHCSEAHDG
jgi:hypothetical protein